MLLTVSVSGEAEIPCEKYVPSGAMVLVPEAADTATAVGERSTIPTRTDRTRDQLVIQAVPLQAVPPPLLSTCSAFRQVSATSSLLVSTP